MSSIASRSIFDRTVTKIEKLKILEKDKDYLLDISYICDTPDSTTRYSALLELPINKENIVFTRKSEGNSYFGYETKGYLDIGFGDLHCKNEEITVECICKKEYEMTLSEIERRLGYKIKLVSEKE